MSNELQWLYRIQPVRPAMLAEGPTAGEAAAVDEHFVYLQGLLRRKGALILAGRTLNTDAGAFGVVIFKAGSEEQARALMQGDPAVAAGVMRAELFPYRVALLAGATR